MLCPDFFAENQQPFLMKEACPYTVRAFGPEPLPNVDKFAERSRKKELLRRDGFDLQTVLANHNACLCVVFVGTNH